MNTDWFEDRTFNLRSNKTEKIKETVEEILTNACNVQDAFEIDKLECRQVEFVNNSPVDFYYRVWIGGADPEAFHLQQFILEQLNKRGLPEVVVSTEW